MIQACYLDIWCSSPFCLTGEIISHPRKASRTSGEATPSDRALSNSSQQYGACFTTTVFYIISINIISYKKSSRPSGSFQEVHLLSMASGTQYSRKTSWELHSFEDKPFSHEIQETTGMSCQLTTPQKSTCHLNRDHIQGNYIFQPWIFRGHVREYTSQTPRPFWARISLHRPTCRCTVFAASNRLS